MSNLPNSSLEFKFKKTGNITLEPSKSRMEACYSEQLNYSTILIDLHTHPYQNGFQKNSVLKIFMNLKKFLHTNYQGLELGGINLDILTFLTC